MSKTLKEQTDRRLGWLAAGMLFFLLSSSAWALDLDQSIQNQNADSAQIMQTLGHAQTGHAQMVNAHTSKDTKKKVGVVLFHFRKKFKYVSNPRHKKVRIARLPAHAAKKNT